MAGVELQRPLRVQVGDQPQGLVGPHLPLSAQIDFQLAAVVEPAVELALFRAQHQIYGPPFFFHQMWEAASHLAELLSDGQKGAYEESGHSPAWISMTFRTESANGSRMHPRSEVVIDICKTCAKVLANNLREGAL